MYTAISQTVITLTNLELLLCYLTAVPTHTRRCKYETAAVDWLTIKIWGGGPGTPRVWQQTQEDDFDLHYQAISIQNVY